VLIVDDHVLFAKTLDAVLAGDPRFEIVGHAENGTDAVAVAFSLAPDVVVMDVEMPGIDGFEATRLIRQVQPSASVVILSAADSPGDSRRALQVGAVAFLTKSRVATELAPTLAAITADRRGAQRPADAKQA
jgi:DNA-binding NarL/FixJ family response regulator